MAFQNILILHHSSAFNFFSPPVFLSSLSNNTIYLVVQAKIQKGSLMSLISNTVNSQMDLESAIILHP